MAIQYSYGAEEVQAKAAQAGKAQAAKVQLQQQFQKDMAMMDYGFRIQAEQRARAWELEKMEIASRMDFQQGERLRLQKEENYQNALNEIDKRVADGVVPVEIAERAKMDAALKHFGAAGTAEFLGVSPGQQQSFDLRQRELDLREQQIGMAGVEAEAGSQALENYLRMVQESNLPEEKKQGLIMQAAGKQAGISPPQGMLTTDDAEPPKQMTTPEMVNAAKFLAGFSESAEQPDPKWWNPLGIMEGTKPVQGLAMIDDEGNFIREATEAEKMAYQEVKNRVATKLKFGEQQPPQQLPAPKSEEEYTALPSGTRYTAPDGTIKVKG